MSTWYDITDSDDIDFSGDGKEMHVLYDYDEWGNKYVSIPVEMVREKLKAGHLLEGK